MVLNDKPSLRNSSPLSAPGRERSAIASFPPGGCRSSACGTSGRASLTADHCDLTAEVAENGPRAIHSCIFTMSILRQRTGALCRGAPLPPEWPVALVPSESSQSNAPTALPAATRPADRALRARGELTSPIRCSLCRCHRSECDAHHTARRCRTPSRCPRCTSHSRPSHHQPPRPLILHPSA